MDLDVVLGEVFLLGGLELMKDEVRMMKMRGRNPSTEKRYPFYIRQDPFSVDVSWVSANV